MKSLGLLIGILLAAFTQAQDLFGDDKKTYMLMPADVISSGLVDRVEISESGRFIVYQKGTMPSLEDLASGKVKQPALTWYVYDRTSKANTKLSLPDTVKEVTMLGDGSYAFCLGYEQSAPQGFLNLKSGALVPTSIPLDNITYAGGQSFAPFIMTQAGAEPAHLIYPTGQIININVPQGFRLVQPISADTKTINFLAYKRGQPTQFAKAAYRFSDGDLSLKPCTREEWQLSNPGITRKALAAWESLGDVMYVKLDNLAKNVKTDTPLRAKLGLANCRPQFNQDGTFVVYQDGGALLVRDVKEVDGALAKMLLAQAQRMKVLNDAKQSAMALIMYAADMDDVLPGAEGWEDKVNPYALNKDMLKNFNYTFRGGSLTSVSDPASTELGFVMGPGGRAVAYIDGHVKWIPNP